MTHTDETTDLSLLIALLSPGSEADLAYRKAISLGHAREDDGQMDLGMSTTTVETEVSLPATSLVRHAEAAVDSPVYPADALSVDIAQVVRLPDSAEGAEIEMGFAPADLLADLIRIAYPAGIYSVAIWGGLESEREHFIAGRVTGSWRIDRELLISKSPHGRVTEVDLNEEQERAMLWAGGER